MTGDCRLSFQLLCIWEQPRASCLHTLPLWAIWYQHICLEVDRHVVRLTCPVSPVLQLVSGGRLRIGDQCCPWVQCDCGRTFLFQSGNNCGGKPSQRGCFSVPEWPRQMWHWMFELLRFCFNEFSLWCNVLVAFMSSDLLFFKTHRGFSLLLPLLLLLLLLLIIIQFL